MEGSQVPEFAVRIIQDLSDDLRETDKIFIRLAANKEENTMQGALNTAQTLYEACLHNHFYKDLHGKVRRYLIYNQVGSFVLLTVARRQHDPRPSDAYCPMVLFRLFCSRRMSLGSSPCRRPALRGWRAPSPP